MNLHLAVTFHFILGTALGLIFPSSLGARDANSERAKQAPNIIYVLADDLGYGDLSCYGQTRFETPHIDALARRGMLFTQHYAGSAVCAPSRSALLTGQHSGHAPVRGNVEHQPEGQLPMPANTYTVAHLLKESGYATGAFGKWGLGYPGSESDPLKMGFDRFYGYNCQRLAHCYYPAFLWDNDERQLLWGNVASQKTDYAPDFIHKKALQFIRENRDQPFFCYYAAIQPHADMIAPESYMERFRGKFLPESNYKEGGHYIPQPESHAAFVAMVTVLDDYVGELMAELEQLGIADNTLVVFTSDNGPHLEGGNDPDYFDSNGILRGYKRDLYEAGIRVPMIATWPSRIPPGSTSEHVSSFWDFLPTVAEILNKPVPKAIDGVSYLPTLLDQPSQAQHEYLYWELPEKGGRVAVRQGNWKAVRYEVKTSSDAKTELYDLANDPSETTDLSAQHPEALKRLEQIMIEAHTPSPVSRYKLYPEE